MKHFFLILFLFLVTPLISFGQSTNGFLGDIAFIDLEPNFPQPNSAFIAEIDDYSITEQTISIAWIINGKENNAFKNFRSIEMTNGDIGQTTTIEARLELAGGRIVRVNQELTPQYLDIIIEPQTRTPSFYLGRGLPSIGSQINLIAVLGSGSFKPENLVYTWRINNDVLDGGSLRGKSTISATVPSGQHFSLYLEVYDLQGLLVAEKALRVLSVSPSLHFYERNPLYGVSTRSIDSLNLIGNSTTVVAEPFNLDLRTYNKPDLLEWKVDGRETKPANNSPYEITLARPAGIGTGQSKINLHIRNTTQFLQGALGNFLIKF